MIRKYQNHKLQTNPWYREEEQHSNHETPERQTKQSNQASFPHQDDCKTRMIISNAQQNLEQLQIPTMGVTINIESTTTKQSFREVIFIYRGGSVLQSILYARCQ